MSLPASLLAVLPECTKEKTRPLTLTALSIVIVWKVYLAIDSIKRLRERHACRWTWPGGECMIMLLMSKSLVLIIEGYEFSLAFSTVLPLSSSWYDIWCTENKHIFCRKIQIPQLERRGLLMSPSLTLERFILTEACITALSWNHLESLLRMSRVRHLIREMMTEKIQWFVRSHFAPLPNLAGAFRFSNSNSDWDWVRICIRNLDARALATDADARP